MIDLTDEDCGGIVGGTVTITIVDAFPETGQEISVRLVRALTQITASFDRLAAALGSFPPVIDYGPLMRGHIDRTNWLPRVPRLGPGRTWHCKPTRLLRGWSPRCAARRKRRHALQRMRLAA